MNHPPLPPAQKPAQQGKAKASTLVVAGFGLFLIVIGLIAGGAGGAIVMAAMLALFTGLYTLLTGRGSWARLAGRKAGSIVAVASVVAVIVGGTLLPPANDTVPTATAEQTENAEPSSAPSESATASPSAPATPKPKPSPDVAPLEGDEIAEPDGDAHAPQDQPKYGVKALALLETLPIKGRAPKTGYDRDQFGQAWLDVDRNGCDTRNDMLNRDLHDIVHANSVPCKVGSGTLDDPYTGTTIPFVRGQDTSIDVQIDHVVALADAWQKGAQQLTVEQRIAFANDPQNLQSTDGPTNAQKGAGDAATWLPPNRGYRCEYVARQISVKATNELWVTRAEYDAMTRVLSDCADMMAPTNQPSPTPSPEPEPAPDPAPEPVIEHPVFANCEEAFLAGAAPLYLGGPGYSPDLDGDSDGVACETAPAPAPVPVPAPAPAPAPAPPADVYYENCAAARAAGAAPVYEGQPGYAPHLDGNSDGVGCE
ncbi:hypothetical protein GCM10027403_26530 [Arthrobacter tecti]